MKGGARLLIVAAIATLTIVVGAGTVSAQDGAQVYQNNCLQCHGSDGTGMLPGQPDFTKSSTWEGVTKDEVLDVVKNGGRIEGMGGEGSGMDPDGGGGKLDDAQREAVVDYIIGMAETSGGEESGGETGGETGGESGGAGGGGAGGAPGFTALLAVTGLLGVSLLLKRK